MSRLYFSPSARLDINEVFDHIAQDNQSAAADFAKKIKETCKRIARFPKIGVQREDLAPGLRCFPMRNYIIFYRTREGRTDVVRVLHGSRDYRNLIE